LGSTRVEVSRRLRPSATSRSRRCMTFLNGSWGVRERSRSPAACVGNLRRHLSFEFLEKFAGVLHSCAEGDERHDALTGSFVHGTDYSGFGDAVMAYGCRFALVGGVVRGRS
jgi:hypothetical protein